MQIKLRFSPLYFKSLLVLTSCIVCTSVMAEGVENEISTQQNVDNPAAATSNSMLDKPRVKALLNNPNSLLIGVAFNFKHIEGTPRTYTEVANIYCNAAKHGNADAQYALGWMYENGRGVSVDRSVAAQLYVMAAEQGQARAIESLSKITDTLPRSDLPVCMLPDPPNTAASEAAPNDAAANSIEASSTEQKAISDETAAFFKSQGRIHKLVKKLAPRYNIDSNLAMAFIAVESGFDTQATSPKNAQGLMQLMPETAERFGVKDTYKAEDNIKGGLAYLRWLLAYYRGDLTLVAAAYNSGEGTVEKYKGVPPYMETQKYVKKIATLYNNSTHPYQDNLVKASPMLKVKYGRVKMRYEQGLNGSNKRRQ
jgi:TPR repeat protein